VTVSKTTGLNAVEARGTAGCIAVTVSETERLISETAVIMSQAARLMAAKRQDLMLWQLVRQSAGLLL
jgi:hypothetical protein